MQFSFINRSLLSAAGAGALFTEHFSQLLKTQNILPSGGGKARENLSTFEWMSIKTSNEKRATRFGFNFNTI